MNVQILWKKLEKYHIYSLAKVGTGYQLQEISGSLLTDAPDSEIDVANFFEIHDIPMTEAFLERYHRGEYLEKKKK